MDKPDLEFEQAHRLLPSIRRANPGGNVGVFYRPGYGYYIRIQTKTNPSKDLPLLIDGVKIEYKGPSKTRAYVLSEDEQWAVSANTVTR